MDKLVYNVDYSLEQNYPNPFNPSTIIKYSLKESGFVSLKIYNILGKEVATLVSGEKSAGSHSVVFNTKDLPSGLYFYRIQSGNFSSVQKMLLEK